MLRNAAFGFAALVLALIAGVALHTLLTTGDTMFAGHRPTNLGVSAGHLAAPKKTPNCVSSQADPADAQHYVAPIRFTGEPHRAMAEILGIVAGMPGVKVVRQDRDYFYAEFRSRLMGFVDDVEFSLSEKDGVIHVRSASRLGRRDFGVNRARVESIRARFSAAAVK